MLVYICNIYIIVYMYLAQWILLYTSTYMVCPKIFMQYIRANVKSTKNISFCNFLRDVFHIRKIFVTVCTYDLRHKWFSESMKWKQKTAKLDTSFSSFVKIIKRAISKLEIYSALKLPFCCSYFFYLWIFNSKKKYCKSKAFMIELSNLFFNCATSG